MSSMEKMCSILIMYFVLKGSYTGVVELLWKITSNSSSFCAGIHALVLLFFTNSVLVFLFFFLSFFEL